MKHGLRSGVCLMVALCLALQGSVAEAQFPNAKAQTIKPGLDYSHIQLEDGPHSIHVLRVKRDRRGWHWTTGLGNGRVRGLAPATSIVEAAAIDLNAQPLAAINGDFYVIRRGNFQGDPLELQIVEGEVVSAPANRGAVWFDADGNPHMGKVQSRFRVSWADRSLPDLPIGLNEERGEDQAVLFTPTMAYNPKDTAEFEFSTKTTDGVELLLEPVDRRNWHPFKVGGGYRARVAGINTSGDSKVTQGTVLLSIGPKLLDKIPALKKGDQLQIQLETEPDLSNARNAIGGGERLLANGQIATSDRDKNRHPRTIIGWDDEHIFLIVVDGRAPKYAIGMTYLELANLALKFGCTEALNLDGGGSSTLWVDGKVLNRTSDGRPRALANALILMESPTRGRGRTPRR